MTPELLELFARHGMPEAMTEPMREHMDSFVPLVAPQPKVTELEPGDSVTMGGRVYRTIHTPGHAYGHLILYDEAAKAVFCGDHVLPQITPNVSFLPGADANPLASFLHSLEAVADLPVAIAYPGHRDPFERFGERAREIVAHHHLRLEKMKGMMGDSPHTAYEVCGMLFGDRLSLHQLRFAIAETIAHLVYMRESGAAEELEGPGLAGTVAYRVV
jgi:glyoxylase-like metal-dependent hydrolase (beta-lactamase superfamily II)